jgi:hypothetical protein
MDWLIFGYRAIGASMVKINYESSDPKESKTPLLRPEIDYSPKTYTLSEQILYGLKMAAIMALVLAPVVLEIFFSN